MGDAALPRVLCAYVPAATLACSASSKGRAMRCTVRGFTSNLAAVIFEFRASPLAGGYARPGAASMAFKPEQSHNDDSAVPLLREACLPGDCTRRSPRLRARLPRPVTMELEG